MYLGIDHSSVDISFAIVNGDSKKVLKVNRHDLAKSKLDIFSMLNLDRKDIDMVGVTYSLGDGINYITNIKNVKNRGLQDISHFGFEEPVGGGTKVYDNIKESNVPAVVIPGLHRGIECLHPYFKNFSHITTADKTSMTVFANDLLEKKLNKKPSFICCSFSSSIMATVVEKGIVRGGFFEIGLAHGNIDLNVLRLIEAGEIKPTNAYLYNSLKNKYDLDYIDSVNPPKNILEHMAYSALRSIFSLVPFTKSLDAIVLCGRLASQKEVYNIESFLNENIGNRLGVNIIVSEKGSEALGSALVAQRAFEKKKEVIGIPIKL